MAEATAHLRFVRVAPRKARVVVDMIRGQQVPKALAMLRHTPRHAAKVVVLVVGCGVGFGVQKELGDSEEMWISKAVVNCGPIYKRFRARSMGRANSIHKRTSHITIVVAAPAAGEEK
ncbi:MAG: 50S ribosomal protein L22 [Nitrospiraceae bacterium]